jgi:hypothetical protein
VIGVVKLSFEPEIILEIYEKDKYADLKIQGNVIARVSFTAFKHEETKNRVFFSQDGKTTIKFNYDVLRIW